MNRQDYKDFIEKQKFLSPKERELLLQAWDMGYDEAFRKIRKDLANLWKNK